jgi:peptide/nickel transport system substrate-binding protein
MARHELELNKVTAALGGNLSRRSFLKRAAAVGVAVPTIAGLLAACEDDDTDDDAPAVETTDDSDDAVDVDTDDDSDDDEPDVADDDTEDADDTADVSDDDRQGGHMNIALASVLEDIHPIRDQSVPMRVVRMNLLEPVVMRDTDGTLRPALIDDWEVDEDGLTYTLHVRHGITFHDGTEYNAEALKFNFDMHLDPDVGSNARSLLGTLESVEVIDEDTVELYLDEPFGPLALHLAHYGLGICSPTAIEEMPDDEFGRAPVGTGPFMFEDWASQSHIDLVKNPDYNWPPHGMFENEGPAYLDSVRFTFVEEGSVRMGTLESGENDAVVYLTADGMNRFNEDPDQYVVIQEYVTGAAHNIYINTEMFPTDDVLVRRAINFAADMETMVEALYEGVNAPTRGVLAPVVPCHDPSAEDYYNYDPDRARELMEEAGFELGDDGVYQKDGQRAEITFVALDSDQFMMYSEFIQASLADVGFDVTLEPVDGATRAERGAQGDGHMFPLGQSGTGDPDVLRNVYHSSNIGEQGTTYNFARYSDPRIDEILEEGVRLAEEDERCPLYAELQHIVIEQALQLPVWLTTHNWAHNARYQNVRMDGSGYYPLLFDVYIED